MIRATHSRLDRSNPGQMVRRVAIGIALFAAGCTASADEVRPPADKVFFPTGLAITPDEAHMFVISANSQLAFDSGTVSVVNLADVDAAVGPWLASQTVPDKCERDASSPAIINCDAAPFLAAGAGVRIGNFAANIGIQDKGGGDLRLIIPVRGDPSVTWVDWDGATSTLSCGDTQGFPLCDEAHRLTRFRNDDTLPQLGNEPFGVYVDSRSKYAVVTHLTAGSATVVDLPISGTPVLADSINGLFQSNANGNVGSVAIAGRAPGTLDDLLYMTSLSENRVQTFSVVRPDGKLPLVAPSSYFFLDRIGANGQASQDARAVAFSPGGERGYFLNRLPPSVAMVDTSLDAQGFPVNNVRAGVDVCREAVGMVVADVGDGERVYVSCFQDGELYVINPHDGLQVEEVSAIGHGPFGIAVSPSRNRLYISNFFEDTIAVVDLTPGSPTRYRVVLRIGKPVT